MNRSDHTQRETLIMLAEAAKAALHSDAAGAVANKVGKTAVLALGDKYPTTQLNLDLLQPLTTFVVSVA